MVFWMFIVFAVTGNFNTEVRETQQEIEKGLIHTSNDITKQYSQYSAYAIEYAKELSHSIEKKLEMRGLTTIDLKKHPDLIEEIVGGEYERSLFALQRSKCSGVFMILDATINPSIANAPNSRAGLYIKNLEPNSLTSSSYLSLLRGFFSIGRQNSIDLHSQWKMEFDVANAPYFSRPIEAATYQNIELSRLYYWNPSTSIPGTNEDIMLCSVPLIDSKGRIFGVCGLEVSSMLFKLSHMPDSDTYQRIFCVLAPYSENTLMISQAFCAGGYSLRNIAKKNQYMIVKNNYPFSTYHLMDGTLYSGLNKQVNLYPEDSVFANEKWVVAVMVPDEDISSAVNKGNFRLTIQFVLLFGIGIIISYYLSRRYVRPFGQSIEMIKSNDFSQVSKTKIAEIDDLMEFLSSQKKVVKPVIEKSENLETKLPLFACEEFVKNTELLSPAERAVFNLYVEGHTAKEITQILNLSINTIKTHNKRIYMKLNVASREELLMYVTMLKEAGQKIGY